MLHKQEAVLFSIERNARNRNKQYAVYLELSSFLVLQNVNSLFESFGKMAWSFLDTMITSSHSFCKTRCMYLAIKGFRSEKGIRLSVGSSSRAPLAALSAASFLQIPTSPGTHIKTTSIWSTSMNQRKSRIYFSETGMPAWEQIRLLAVLLCK